jgi:ARC6-like, IMS domain/DnaJ domain/SnoaL-like domain
MLSALQGKQAVQIPLDYYRILGLPLAASDEQLRQAYGDRIVQLPRREYSQAAIASRKQLIEEAYVVLSVRKERRAYDRIYLAHAYDPDRTKNANGATENQAEGIDIDTDTQSLSIEIAQQELVGALLILQELGEYEQVLKFGRPYLVHKNSAAVEESDEIAADRPDVVLTVSLACLELGREQWQQGHYENAAISLETGLELLGRENLFPNVRAEIQADLYKLRPYRILELIALSDDKATERQQGLELLRIILEERGGIDGPLNDHSGLTIDDFLRFIQQLRNHLTVTEQHKLFEAESKRPSAVATYLAVYALIARGFTQRQPALIRQAKQMLIRLGKRQDVHLEQSLCALLLGQTEEASRTLEMSQEYQALAFIREKSQDSPDLLPGLCLYSEQWLQNEVFPHFRDLIGQQASLKDYFADQEVQAYLEALPTDAETSSESSRNNRSPDIRHNSNSTVKNTQQPASSVRTPSETPMVSHLEAERVATNHSKNPAPQPQRQRKRKPSLAGKTAQTKNPRHPVQNRIRRRTLNSGKRNRLVLTVFGSLAGILVFGFAVTTTFGWLKNLFSPPPTLQGEQLSIQINQPPINIPDPNSKPQFPEGPLTQTTGREVIQTWLSTKSTALGPNHDASGLGQILTTPAIKQWQEIVQQNKASNRYRKYEHTVQDVIVDTNQGDKNHAAAEATVTEVTQYFENGQTKKPEREKIRVKYDLVRVDGAWRIREMSVLNKIS